MSRTKGRGFQYSDLAKQIVGDFEAKQNPENRFNNFKIPDSFIVADGKKHIKNLIFDGNKKLTNDNLPINQYSFGLYDKINKTLINSWFLGYQEYSLLSQNGIIQNIIQCYAEECVREWIDIVSISKDKSNASREKIKILEAAFERFKIKDKIKNVIELCMIYGGCKIYPKIRGDDKKEGGDELLTPLLNEKIGKGSVLYFKVIEPLYASPLSFNATNPLAEDFYAPSSWTILAQPVHTSRLLHFCYNYVPTLLKPVYWFNGMPLIQLCFDYIFGFETVRQNVVGISGRYNINVFKTNLNALLNYKDGSTFKSDQDPMMRLKLAQALQTNFSIFALSNDKASEEEWQQFNMTIAGLAELLNQNAELVCAVARIPAIKLFGTSPKGFNSTGEYELKMFHQLIHSKQESIIQPNLQIIFEYIQLNEFGYIDPDLKFVFKPLDSPSAIEKSQIQVQKKEINLGYLEADIITVQEVRKRLNDDPDSGFDDLSEAFIDEDFNNEQLDEFDNEEELN